MNCVARVNQLEKRPDDNEIVTMGGVLSKLIKLQTLKNGGTPDLSCNSVEQTRVFVNIFEILRLGISAGSDPEKVALGMS